MQAAVAAAALATIGTVHATPSVTGVAERAATVTFRDIAPIIAEHCAGCHRPGSMAPFPLLTFEDARKHAGEIARVTGDREMPPWLPEPGFGTFANERRLSDREIETIRRWVEEGAREGNRSDLPLPPRDVDGWQLGQPDLIVTTSGPYLLPAGRGDVYRNFAVPVAISRSRYVRAVELRIENSAAVHHARLLVDRSGTARRLDDEDPEPGYDGMQADEAEFPDGHFIGWSPGKTLSPDDDPSPWRLDPGTDLVVQLHLRPSAKPVPIRATVGMFFTERAPTRTPFVLSLESKTIDIPPGAADYRVEDSYVLPVDVEALRIYPHAHYLGTDLKAFARLPDGSTRWLLWIKHWDPGHQDEYRYAEPLHLPAGTTVTMQFTYDNSSANPLNPSRPPRRVRYGPKASDEMAELLIQVEPTKPSDLPVLDRDAARKTLRVTIAGLEQLAANDPANAAVHRSLALAYLRAGAADRARTHAEDSVRLAPTDPYSHAAFGSALAALGRFDDAVVEYRRALAVKPSMAEAHNDLGVALQSLGRTADAIDEYRESLRLRPASASAHNNLGNAFAALGRADDAIREYRSALALDPASAEAHNNLGGVFQATGRVGEAIDEYRAAVAIAPDYAEAHNNLGVALRSAGKLQEAIAELRHAVSANPRYALAHNNLGNAFAASGDVVKAVDEYREAVRLAPDYVEARTNLANALASRGELEDAAAQLQEALRRKSDYAPAHGNLATVLMLRGRYDEATTEFREALRLAPEWPNAMAGLAWILATRPGVPARDSSEAIRLAERAADLTSRQDAIVLDTLAAAYASAGQFERAVTTAERAAALATAERNGDLAQRVRKRIELYRGGKPYVETAGVGR